VVDWLPIGLTSKFGYEDVSYTRAKTFATDTFSEFFDYQRYAAKFGFRDVETNGGERANIEELTGQESYLINKLLHYTKVNEENSKVTFIKPREKK
jgi:hypothetical protein